MLPPSRLAARLAQKSRLIRDQTNMPTLMECPPSPEKGRGDPPIDRINRAPGTIQADRNAIRHFDIYQQDHRDDPPFAELKECHIENENLKMVLKGFSKYLADTDIHRYGMSRWRWCTPKNYDTPADERRKKKMKQTKEKKQAERIQEAIDEIESKGGKISLPESASASSTTTTKKQSPPTKKKKKEDPPTKDVIDLTHSDDDNDPEETTGGGGGSGGSSKETPVVKTEAGAEDPSIISPPPTKKPRLGKNRSGSGGVMGWLSSFRNKGNSSDDSSDSSDSDEEEEDNADSNNNKKRSPAHVKEEPKDD